MSIETAVKMESHSFTGRRITLITRTPFAQVVERLEGTFPSLEPKEIDALVDKGDAGALQAYLEKKTPGASFSVFMTMRQGLAMSDLGTPLKANLYLIGNALIARSMFAVEPAAGLGAPVRVVVTEAADGTTHIDYDEPSSMFSQFSTLRDSTVPSMLDQKFREALTSFAG
ncbi:MAG: DUF302 domain-containing protein [Deltaproteobacteria bacterium]